MRGSVKGWRIAPVAVAAMVGATLPAIAGVSPAQAAASTVGTQVDDSATHWQTGVENPGLGSVGYQADDSGPDGGYAALMKTGPGDPGAGRGGKPYLNLNDSSLFGLPLTDVTSLSYSTKVLSTPQPQLAPAINLALWRDSTSGAPCAGAATSCFAGSLVYEPIYNTDTAGDAPTTDSWQTWRTLSNSGRWWYSKDLYNTSGQVVVPRQETHRFGYFLDVFQSAGYNIRLLPGASLTGGPVNVSLGQSSYNAGTSNITSEVDGVTVGTNNADPTTYDFESLGDCTSFDQGSKTLTLTKDCSTTTTQQMGDGWTFDGNGHTLTAVEDTDHPNFPGVVVASAVGDSSGAAKLNVHDLTINSSGFSHEAGGNSGGMLTGIYMLRAGGTLNNVTVDGISHGNGVQEGIGIWVRNKDVDNGNLNVPTATVDLSNVTVTKYQKSGLILDGHVSFTADHLDIGHAAGVTGVQTTTLAANSVQISRGAKGSITASTIDGNRYATDDSSSGDHTEATAMLLYNAGDVTLANSAITGVDSDYGIEVDNDGSSVLAGDPVATDLTVSCSTISRTSGGNADPAFGIGVGNDSDAGSSAVTLNSVAFSGWAQDTDGDVATGTSPDCQLSTTLVAAPSAVTIGGSTTLSGIVSEPNEAAVSGVTVTLERKLAGESSFTQVGAAQTTGANGRFSFTDSPSVDATYRVQLSKAGATSGTSDTVTVPVNPKSTTVTLTASPKKVTSGGSTTLRGKASDSDGGVAGATVTLTRTYAGESTATTVGTTTTGADGTFSFSDAPAKSATYQVSVSAADHSDATSAQVAVSVAPKVSIKASKTKVKVGTKVTFTGLVKPASGTRVALQTKVGSTWTRIALGKEAANGAYSVSWTPTKAGTYTLRVYVSKKSPYTGAPSATVTLRVTK